MFWVHHTLTRVAPFRTPKALLLAARDYNAIAGRNQARHSHQLAPDWDRRQMPYSGAVPRPRREARSGVGFSGAFAAGVRLGGIARAYEVRGRCEELAVFLENGFWGRTEERRNRRSAIEK